MGPWRWRVEGVSPQQLAPRPRSGALGAAEGCPPKRRLDACAGSREALAMTDTVEFALRSLAIGAGATLVMDGWALLLRQLGISSLNFAMLGRWIGHLSEGQLIHTSIARAAPVRGELALGWLAHYAIGISFAALLLAAFGLRWAHRPSLVPA